MNWHEYFTYNAETGELIWKERPIGHFKNKRAWETFMSRFAGGVAGCKALYKETKKGRCVLVSVHGKLHLVHRIIWEMYYGPIPMNIQIDHIDLNPLNNKLDNLRLCTASDNMKNCTIRKNNKCGAKGVSLDVSPGRYRAQIRVNGKAIRIGSYSTIKAASDAYALASEKYHGEFGRKN